MRDYREDLNTVLSQVGFVKHDIFFIVSVVLGLIARKHKKEISGDQTPRNVFYLTDILQRFSNSKALVMVRDSRDVILSQKNKWRASERRGQSRFEVWRTRLNYHPITASYIWNQGIKAALKYRNPVYADRVKFVVFEDFLCNLIENCPMRILLVNRNYFVTGGPEKYLFSLENELKQWDLIPFCVRLKQNLATPYEKYFVSSPFGEGAVRFDGLDTSLWSKLKYAARSIYCIKARNQLVRLIDDVKPDAALFLNAVFFHRVSWMRAGCEMCRSFGGFPILTSFAEIISCLGMGILALNAFGMDCGLL